MYLIMFVGMTAPDRFIKYQRFVLECTKRVVLITRDTYLKTALPTVTYSLFTHTFPCNRYQEAIKLVSKIRHLHNIRYVEQLIKWLLKM